MFPDALLDDFSDVFEGRSQLFLLVVAKCDVVGDFAVITDRIHGVDKLSSSFLVLPLLVKNTAFIHDDV